MMEMRRKQPALRRKKDSTMFISLYRLYKSFELGMTLSYAADEIRDDPDALSALVRTKLALPTYEAPEPIAMPERELPLAA